MDLSHLGFEREYEDSLEWTKRTEGDFRFRIEVQDRDYDYEKPGFAFQDVTPDVKVALPHQCDSWEIAGGDLDPTSVDQAITDLLEFITQANLTLVELRRLRDSGLLNAPRTPDA